MNAEREWLDSLKVGDEVAIIGGMYTEVATVTRATPTQVGVGHRKFWRKDGRAVGSSRGWRSMWLREVTDKIRDEAEHRALVSNLSATNWRAFPLVRLRAAKEARDNDPPQPCEHIGPRMKWTGAVHLLARLSKHFRGDSTTLTLIEAACDDWVKEGSFTPGWRVVRTDYSVTLDGPPSPK